MYNTPDSLKTGVFEVDGKTILFEDLTSPDVSATSSVNKRSSTEVSSYPSSDNSPVNDDFAVKKIKVEKD